MPLLDNDPIRPRSYLDVGWIFAKVDELQSLEAIEADNLLLLINCEAIDLNPCSITASMVSDLLLRA